MNAPTDMEVDIDVMRGIVRDMADADPTATCNLLESLSDLVAINYELSCCDICPAATERDIETARAAIIAAAIRGNV